MSMVSDALSDRIRRRLGDKPGLVEKKMFGGRCFMVDGNIALGTSAAGELLVRVDPKCRMAALARPGAFVIKMGIREMKGFVAVAPDSIGDEATLGDWVALALAYTTTLPPK